MFTAYDKIYDMLEDPGYLGGAFIKNLDGEPIVIYGEHHREQWDRQSIVVSEGGDDALIALAFDLVSLPEDGSSILVLGKSVICALEKDHGLDIEPLFDFYEENNNPFSFKDGDYPYYHDMVYSGYVPDECVMGICREQFSDYFSKALKNYNITFVNLGRYANWGINPVCDALAEASDVDIPCFDECFRTWQSSKVSHILLSPECTFSNTGHKILEEFDMLRDATTLWNEYANREHVSFDLCSTHGLDRKEMADLLRCFASTHLPELEPALHSLRCGVPVDDIIA